MKERPILFNADMVRAVIAGRKTQTRRPFRVQPPDSWSLAKVLDDGRAVFDVVDGCIPAADVAFVKSPFGAPGDLLWVREAWAHWMSVPDDVRAGYMTPAEAHELGSILYKADYSAWDWKELHDDWEWTFRPSIHMPRWASRLTLRVERVWAELVQGISVYDIFDEGIGFEFEGRWCCYEAETARREFAKLWDSIYAARGLGWDANPLAWACEFSVVGGPST